ncbi:MAG: hypothetical protein A3K09_06640 [Nitrospinae bacterium RIFCSPLOWO2_12_FULL_47_7]|nr:MAG: hypothetical protein A3K09_06640 [Nitrospinae bacterium RIFCSPLOWO2_12_FULL_47_7]
MAKPPAPPARVVHEPEVESESIEDGVHEGAPMWYLSFADMMTNMFVFFALLVAIGSVEQEKFKQLSESLRLAFRAGEKGEGGTFRQLDLIHGQSKIDQTTIHSVDEVGALVGKEVNNILTDVKQFVSTHKLANKISAHADERGAVITISDVVLFSKGESRITPEGIKTIKQIFELLKDFDYEVKIEGHTDDTPIRTDRFPSNWELSASRASDVARMLVESGFPPNKLSVEGFSQYRPKVPNDTEEHRAMNRRIEVVFQQGSIRKHMVSFLQKGD